MPNLRGGKAYKKSKGKSKTGDEEEVVFIDKEADQYVGRIMKLLGNLNVQVYCEDKKQRVCKIRSGIKKRIRFETGDVVLISLRDCELSTDALDKGERSDRGDIIAKYHPQQFKSLRDKGVNPLIFANLDTINTVTTMIQNGQKAAAELLTKDPVDDLFDRGGDTSESESKSESDGELDINNI
jgi:initiation factor 1A